MAVEIVFNSWFEYDQNIMATKDFLSQFKLKHLSQSIWFNLIHVLLLLIVIVGLGFMFSINLNEYTNL